MVRRTRIRTWWGGAVALWVLCVPTAWGQPTGAPPTSAPERGDGARPVRPTTPPPPRPDAGEPDVEDEPEAEDVDLSNTWGYSRTRSPRPRYVRNTQDPIAFSANPVGFYSGVSVQGNHVPPFPATSTTPVVMTWTGFERAPEGSRVFFELSAAATYDVDRKGQTLRIRMRNTKVNVRNNMRRLDLRYFQTPVRTVKVSRRGRDTVATIVLERNAEPTVQIIDGKAGYSLLVVQFADQAATATSTPPPPPPPSP